MPQYTVDVRDKRYRVTARYAEQAVLRAVRRLPRAQYDEYLQAYCCDGSTIWGRWYSVHRDSLGRARVIPGQLREYQYRYRPLLAPHPAAAAELFLARYRDEIGEQLDIRESATGRTLSIARELVT